MIKTITKSIYPLIILIVVFLPEAYGQTTSISGKVTETENGEGLPGVNIVIKGTVTGTITDIDGNFNLSSNVPAPLTILVSYIGFKTQEIEITDANTTGLDLQMEEQTLLGQEVVVSASRIEESILQSPVTIEKLDRLAIQQGAAPSFYDQLNNIKGVQSSQGSLTFNAINTRGFATIANIRFVALVDGMDISAPLLNFPTGNLVGLSELDAESVELVPGAASALYGPNAFNGILFMNSKSPFEYQGLSAQVKLGVTDSDAGGSNPMYNYSLRYAKAFNNKFAFKVNFNLLDATDWSGNDYTTDRVTPGNQVGAPNFDGMNLYGDEFRIIIPPSLTGLLNPLDIRRSGIQEELLLDNEDARAIKASAALHYRFNDKIEGIYNYRYGGGSTIYQGSAKFVLRDFNQQFHKLEVKGDNFFVRAYRTETDDGDSYNLDAMGIFVNELISPSGTEWAPTYAQSYVLALQGYFSGAPFSIPGGNVDAAHGFARFAADNRVDANGVPNPLTNTELLQHIETVRNSNLNIDATGAGFIEGSRLWHGEFNYNFKNQIEAVEIQVGGNVRRYDIWSAGTIFDELQADKSFDRVVIDEWGIYTQLSKRINDLKLSGSIRYDKNENFEGQFNPRLAAVYTIRNNHNIRASFQTGFRNPDTQSQFIWFPTSQGILVGSTEANAARYGLHNGGSYTASSVSNYLGGGGSFDVSGNTIGGDPTLLQTATFGFVEPEQLTAIEFGYKGVIADQLLLDVNWYHNSYKDFIAQFTVFNKQPVIRADTSIATGATGDVITAFRPYVNAKETITSNGIGVGLTYSIGGGYTITGNYNWTDFSLDDVDTENELEAGFNTPEHRFGAGIHNRNVGKNIGFSLNYRWQDEFFWESAFGKGVIPEFGVVDFQVNYKIKSLKSFIKLGSTNLLGGDYRTNIGPGFVGSQYYLSITYDEFLH